MSQGEESDGQGDQYRTYKPELVLEVFSQYFFEVDNVIF